MQFNFKKLDNPDLILVEPKLYSDERGFFLENYKESVFSENGINAKFVQDNYSHSVNGVLRGLHFQKPPMAQAKLVTVIRGEIFDVAVDIRKNSPFYGKWSGVILSEKNHHLFYIPKGFAHGFCTLSQEADVLYKVNNEYSSSHDSGIVWNDPQVNISWPIQNPIISQKDSQLPNLANMNSDFTY